MSTYVLIHGAWHGAWCWYKVILGLETAGHEVIAPDLPGLGRDRTPIDTISLAGWADHVCNMLSSNKGSLILVGHSRGGIVISEIAERIPEKIQKLVYLAAFLIPNGETCLENAQKDSESLLLQNLKIDEGAGYATVADSAIEEVFYADCMTEDIALAKSLLLPEPLAPSATPLSITNENFGRVPRTYIECLRDKAISPGHQKKMYMALPCERMISMESDHSPFFSNPKELTEYLLGLS